MGHPARETFAEKGTNGQTAHDVCMFPRERRQQKSNTSIHERSCF